MWQVQTFVSAAAKRTTASEHTERLAKAKQSVEGPFREPQWQVSCAAKTARPSDHTLDLSRPKKVADDYQPCRNVEWRVSNAAKNAVASNRSVMISCTFIHMCHTYMYLQNERAGHTHHSRHHGPRAI